MQIRAPEKKQIYLISLDESVVYIVNYADVKWGNVTGAAGVCVHHISQLSVL